MPGGPVTNLATISKIEKQISWRLDDHFNLDSDMLSMGEESSERGMFVSDEIDV